MQKNAPIGIFDSGIGGLTVAHAIKEELPNEHLIYFGDTAHLPYGDKSTATIQAYAIKIADFFLQQNCKIIVIACNSASAAANDLLKEYVASRATIVNVIEPMVDFVVKNESDKTVGVIGTKQTVNSNIYSRSIKNTNSSINVKSLATPLLVPMIEEGFLHNKIAHNIIEKYLRDASLKNIDSLVLGCTHYPLIKNELSQFYDNQVNILDSSIITAEFLKEFLASSDLSTTSTQKGNNQFFVSDLTESFEHSAKLFFGEPVVLQKHQLWE
ncbi:MAG: glutamate racemase [Cyclobacteriaceae bacterium]|nr:glutamate racemase [Cyclobacteriaceae bacterium]